MPSLMQMRWEGVTPEQYEAIRAASEFESDPADGGLVHSVWFDDGAMRVIDVWESPEQFQAFFESRVAPAVQEHGLEGEPEVEWVELHNHFNPAAA
jgi:heme-degrading monooxygenase HmoA